LRAHREEVRKWAGAAPRIDMHEVNYPALVRDPLKIISKLVQFLGQERLPNELAMATVIRPELYRQRSDRHE
jgi:LPS sulfotransferase NodH